ncbi:hypothetical protein AB1Y20_001392 [Prymnesium parvum]|uniref:PSI-F n=1 Tax=Prymnesium parvum TaxID=97485 RepID=A0AB34KCF5_PRYPA|mmetsp:Transcript_34259/g.83234  ORF Transcript_34259/g.83234 Transcript_34259/m.83234 type:complete len:149 (-) Transcript_34259:378-824(-)
MRRLIVAALCLAALLAVAAEKPKGLGPKARSDPATTAKAETAASLSKLREAMMSWFCPQPGNEKLLPCQTFAFMKDLRATPTADAKKKKLADRSAAMKNKNAEERAQQQKAAKEAYIQMYRAFCAQEGQRNSEVCTHALLKKLYGTTK